MVYRRPGRAHLASFACVRVNTSMPVVGCEAYISISVCRLSVASTSLPCPSTPPPPPGVRSRLLLLVVVDSVTEINVGVICGNLPMSLLFTSTCNTGKTGDIRRSVVQSCSVRQLLCHSAVLANCQSVYPSICLHSLVLLLLGGELLSECCQVSLSLAFLHTVWTPKVLRLNILINCSQPGGSWTVDVQWVSSSLLVVHQR